MNKRSQRQLKMKSMKVLGSLRMSQARRYVGSPMYLPTRPKIQMEGKWLEELGFHIGDRVNVEYGEGKICITLAEPARQPAMAAEPSGYMASE